MNVIISSYGVEMNIVSCLNLAEEQSHRGDSAVDFATVAERVNESECLLTPLRKGRTGRLVFHLNLPPLSCSLFLGLG